MNAHQDMAAALDEGNEAKALEALEGHPELANLRFLNHERRLRCRGRRRGSPPSSPPPGDVIRGVVVDEGSGGAQLARPVECLPEESVAAEQTHIAAAGRVGEWRIADLSRSADDPDLTQTLLDFCTQGFTAISGADVTA